MLNYNYLLFGRNLSTSLPKARNSLTALDDTQANSGSEYSRIVSILPTRRFISAWSRSNSKSRTFLTPFTTKPAPTLFAKSMVQSLKATTSTFGSLAYTACIAFTLSSVVVVYFSCRLRLLLSRAYRIAATHGALSSRDQ